MCFWLLISVRPLYHFNYRKWHDARITIFFTLTEEIVNFGMAFLLLTVAEWTIAHQFGLLHWIPEINIWLYTILGLLLLDLIGAYLAHYVQYKIRWMWCFHPIHQTHTWTDTTSVNRHHMGESVIRFIFTILLVLIPE